MSKYRFDVHGTWEIPLDFTMFNTGITLEATMILKVDGYTWSSDLDADDQELLDNTLWDEPTGEFDIKGGCGGVNPHVATDHDEEVFLLWVKDIVSNLKPTGFDVEQGELIPRSEWED